MTAARWAADEELRELVAALREGTLSAQQAARLNDSIANSPSAREAVARYTLLHAMLEMAMRPAKLERTPDGQPAVPAPAVSANCTPSGFPVIVVDSFVPAPAFSLRSPVGGWLFSYAVSVLLVGIGLLTTWAWKVSDHTPDVARSSPPPAPAVEVPEPEPRLVGWITGMADCRWGNQRAATVGATVPLGREYRLAAGLMEIAYQNGAKVILQGPCTYEVDSQRGGFLSLGKLTARVETKGEGGRGKAEGTDNQKSEIRSQKSPFPLPPSSFVVRTPTAIVTDLGTEFGVEVDRSGVTQSHVFRGRIELRPTAGRSLVSTVGKGAEGKGAVQLGENESARVGPDREGVVRVTRGGPPAGHFHRRMPESVPIKLFNTGAGLGEGRPDPHWQLVARSDDRDFRARPAFVAVVSKAPAGMWVANEPARSQWITMSKDSVWAPGGVTYTFRTMFELADAIAETAAVQGWFIADDGVAAIRINGKEVSLPRRADADLPFRDFTPFSIKRGFVEGVNTLEIDVRTVGAAGAGKTTSPMGLRVELRGFVLGGARMPPAGSGLAGAVVINAQFYDPSFNSAGSYSGQGAYADPGNNCWSSVQVYASGDPHGVRATPLYTSTGAPTSVTFACSNVRGGWWNEATPTDLLGIGCYTQSDQPTLLPDPATFTIGGLTPGGTYSIYLYAVGDAANNQGTIFSFDGFATSQTCTGTATSGFVLGANYCSVSHRL